MFCVFVTTFKYFENMRWIFCASLEGGGKEKFPIFFLLEKNPTVEQFAKTILKIDLEQFVIKTYVFFGINDNSILILFWIFLNDEIRHWIWKKNRILSNDEQASIDNFWTMLSPWRFPESVEWLENHQHHSRAHHEWLTICQSSCGVRS